MLKGKGIISEIQRMILNYLYWSAVSMEKVKTFPDDISRWPVEMLIEVKIEELKDLFYRISMEIMNRLKQ